MLSVHAPFSNNTFFHEDLFRLLQVATAVHCRPLPSALPSIAIHCRQLLPIAVHCRSLASIAGDGRQWTAMASNADSNGRQSTAMAIRDAQKTTTTVSVKTHLTEPLTQPAPMNYLKRPSAGEMQWVFPPFVQKNEASGHRSLLG